MKKLLLAALAAVSCGSAGVRVGEMPNAVAIAPAPIPVPVPAPLGPFPLDGAFVYAPDPECAQGGFATQIPDLTTAVCMRGKAVEYITREVVAGRVGVGPKFNACSYPSDPAWADCVTRTLAKAVPEIRFGQTPFYLVGSIGGVKYVGCAAGVAYSSFIRVSLADASRVMDLVAWESLNSLLAYTLDRYTAADGPIVTAGTAYARRACYGY